MKRISDWEKFLDSSLNSGADCAWKFRCYEALSSTMDTARELIPELGSSMALVLARTQSAGRGRRGKTWLTTEGSFIATYVLPYDERKVMPLDGFSLVVGCILKNVLETYSCKVKLKWPNDILSHQSEKLGGILIELLNVNSKRFVSLGIGVNLTHTPESLPETASLVSIGGERIEAIQIAADLSQALDEGWRKFKAEGFPAFKQEWLASAAFIDRLVALNEGKERVTGILLGVSDNGMLLLETKNGVKEIVSGEIVGELRVCC